MGVRLPVHRLVLRRGALVLGPRLDAIARLLILIELSRRVKGLCDVRSVFADLS